LLKLPHLQVDHDVHITSAGMRQHYRWSGGNEMLCPLWRTVGARISKALGRGVMSNGLSWFRRNILPMCD
jgi:hypothetical protein